MYVFLFVIPAKAGIQKLKDMYQLQLLCIGTLKEKYWREACAEYEKRLKPMARVRVQEIPEEPFAGVADRARIVAKEGEKILKAIPKDAYVIMLSPEAKQKTSEHFAQVLREEGERGRQLVFLIGGPLGFSQDVRDRADTILSLSSLTFTHQLARIVLIEQLYRAMTIVHGKQYHY